jgi:transcriptional regulator with XRE-family HTH domain
MLRCMGAASDLVREARRRSGLTQRRLAALTGTTQSAIARIESGATEPSFERVAELVRACGLQLVSHLAPADDADWSVASANLRLSPEARVRQHQAAVRFARAGREALVRGRA